MLVGFALINALAVGMATFLVAAGVTLIFGMLRILNISHGSIFMIGAYLALTLVGTEPDSVWQLIGASLLSGLALALIGLVVNFVAFRKLRTVHHAYSLIATFAMMMVANGLVKMIWGVNYHSVSTPDALSGAAFVGPVLIPIYSLFIIAMGIVTFLVLEFLIHRSSVGKTIRAIAYDDWVSNLSGINTPLVYAAVVMGAFFLAGMAGGMLLPNQSVSPLIYESYLLQSFIVVIVGGLGSIRGAFVAALLMGLVEAVNFLLMPELPGLLIYLLLIGFLLWRPQGLFPRPGASTADNDQDALEPVSVPSAMPARFDLMRACIMAGVAAVLLSLPLWINEGLLFIVGFAMVEALLALSWNFLFGYIGLVTFGHAAFFGLGAYFVGLFLGDHGAFFPLLLLGSLVIGALAAAVVGFIALRRMTGLALGILTLSLGEILRHVIIYSKTLGSDDGLSGISRPVIDLGLLKIDLSSESAYFWFLCVACAAAAYFLWAISASRFGRMMVTIRQDPIRAQFLGINVLGVRLTAFVISGAVAALAGGLLAPWTQIVTPDSVGYLHSAQPMLNTLLGGSGFFWGPAVGAAVFSTLSYATRTLTGLSEVVSGSVLLFVVLSAPGGILGLGKQLGLFAGRRRVAIPSQVAAGGSRP